jgi:hypothetical protein
MWQGLIQRAHSRFSKVGREGMRLWRTVTLRIALTQALAFAGFSIFLLFGAYQITAGQLQREAHFAASQEYQQLSQLYASNGQQGLTEAIYQRIYVGAPMLYVLANQDGEVLVGSFATLPVWPGDAERMEVDFYFSPPQEEPGARAGRLREARGQVGRLLGGPILLVARDMGAATDVVRAMNTGMIVAVALATLFAIAVGFLASRDAARRMEMLSRVTRDVIAGDLDRRAPVWEGRDVFADFGRDLNAMLARLQQLIIASRTSGDAIAHEVRSPLTRMLGQVESALDKSPDTARDRAALTKMSEEARRLLQISNAILRLSRMRAAANWTFEPLDLSGVLIDLAEMYEPAAEDLGHTFKLEVAPGLSVEGERSILAQAVSNLIENALKYTPAGGQVTLRAHLKGAGVEVAVIDSGPGVPEEDRKRVLERFVKLEASRSTDGVGLGLSLVAAAMDLHKGEVVLEDGITGPTGPGLKVRLYIPSKRRLA